MPNRITGYNYFGSLNADDDSRIVERIAELERKVAEMETTMNLMRSAIAVNEGGMVSINATTVEVNAASITVNSAMSRFSGVVQCDTIIANSVVGSSYTPGAGNIW